MKYPFKLFGFLFSICFILFFLNTAIAQQKQIDSILNRLKTAKEDTNKVYMYYCLCWRYQQLDHKKTLFYAECALRLSEKINYLYGKSDYYTTLGIISAQEGNNLQALYNFNKGLKMLELTDANSRKADLYLDIGIVYKQSGDYDKAIEYFQKCLEISKKINYIVTLGNVMTSMGDIYFSKAKYDKALEYYLKAVPLYESHKLIIQLGKIYTRIGEVYNEIKNYKKALEYFNKDLKISEDYNLKEEIANSCDHIADIFKKQGNKNKALDYYLKALKLSEELNNKNETITYNLDVGEIYMDIKDYNLSLVYFLNAIKISEEINNRENKAMCYIKISPLYLNLNKIRDAENYCIKGLTLAKEISSIKLKNDAYKNLSMIYERNKDFSKAFEYHKLYTETNDSILDNEKSKQIIEMQTKYETEKKQKENEILTKTNEIQKLKLYKRTIIIFAVSIGSVLFLVFTLITFNYYRNKQTKRKLFNKVLETEEKERKHFAEELHDGLGPLLSTVNLYVNELGESSIDVNEKNRLLDTTNQILDEAIRTTRQISNNLMPGDLNKYGLIRATENFCNKLNHTGKIKLSLKTETMKEHYNKTIELILYRVTTELINNTLKHASAKNINISLKEKDNKIFLHYIDDGKGFNVETTLNDPIKGLGLNNIINRIKSVGGICEFQSIEGKETSVKVEINLKHFVA